MDKTKALERLTALESEASELRKIIEAPEREPSLLTKPKPGGGDDYWVVCGYTSDPMGCDHCCANSTSSVDYDSGNIFQTEELAAAYAEAIETMLLLRHQPGTVPAISEKAAWVIRPQIGLLVVEVCGGVWQRFKVSQISPAFVSSEKAEAAITTLGQDRILRMFKTFHHVD